MVVHSDNRSVWRVFLTAAVAIAVAAATYLSVAGTGDEAIVASIIHSGQLAFVLYVLVLLARPLQQIIPSPPLNSLRRNRRFVGVAFAGIMATHLLLIIFRVKQSPELAFPLQTLLVGGGAYMMIGLMFITSFERPRNALGPRVWKWLHRIGLIWIGFVFAAPSSLEDFGDPGYLKFGIPVAFALLIRAIAWRRSRQQGN